MVNDRKIYHTFGCYGCLMVFDFQTWAMDDKLMISDDCTATSLRNIAEFKYTV